jgi:diguanylate cyclase (GGDEF)-like protein/PAS domain S-box-containing protein
VFLVNGAFFTVRALLSPTGMPANSVFALALTPSAVYLITLITSTLWTFGFILLINQRLNSENREAKDNLELIFNTIPDAVLITHLDDGRFTGANDGFTALTGYTRHDVIGKTSMEIRLWEDPLEREEIVTQLIEKGFYLNKQVRLRHKNGSRVNGMMSAKLFFLQGIPYIISITHDMSERIQAEEALLESESKMRAIAESARDAIVMLDLEGRVSYWNPAAVDIFGYTAEEVMGRSLHDLLAPPQNLHAYHAAFPSFMKTGQGEAIGKSHEIVAYRKDGSEIPVQLSLSSFKLNDGWYAVGIISDITERKRLEAELQLQATLDELTGISNRRYFLKLATNEIKRALRLNHPLTIAILDIDHFKNINDSYGHASGDQALVAFSQICQEQLREIDLFARIGGDEFALLLPETNPTQSVMAVERVRIAIAAQVLTLAGEPVTITISAGIAGLEGQCETLDALMDRADQALYRAKGAGRNRIEVAPLAG